MTAGFLINTQTSDVGYISTIRQSKAGETGVVRFVTDHPDGTANLYIDCNPTTGIVSLKSSSQVCLVQADGGVHPTQPNSIATRGWVESVVGSGGSVNPDTVPGTGATARWEEQSVDVSNVEPNQQVYGALYSYNGIFTDGLHWTSDGYQWNTSDPSQRNAPLNAYVGRDDGKVVKGNGNEYITSRHISNDMKSWRAINTYYDKPFYIDGEFYAENGSKKYDRSANSWVTSTAFGGTLSAGTPKNVCFSRIWFVCAGYPNRRFSSLVNRA